MENSEEVQADPHPPLHQDDTVENPTCFACFSRPNRQTRQMVTIDPSQVQARAKVDTLEYVNSFSRLDPHQPARVYLCTPCRSNKKGWPAMARPKTFGKHKVATFLKAWKARVSSRERRSVVKTCYVCQSLEGSRETVLLSDTAASKRVPIRDLTLFRMAASSEIMRHSFVTDFCRRSNVHSSVAKKLLETPAELFLCHVHLNHSRYAQEAATAKDERSTGARGGFCVFTGAGCVAHGSRLRPLPVFRNSDLEDVEQWLQFQDIVVEHSDGVLQATEVQGKHACAQCLYIVTLGRQGIAPSADMASVCEAVDRWLIRCVLLSFESKPDFTSLLTVGHEQGKALQQEATTLRNSLIEITGGVAVLPFRNVVACRRMLARLHDGTACIDIDSRTLVSRTSKVLAAKNIHLQKFGFRTRCYILGGSLESVVYSTLRTKFKPQGPSLSDRDKMTHLDKVGVGFSNRRAKYWEGDWCLNDEISAVPEALWRSVVMQMASIKKLCDWNVSAMALDKSVSDVFPLSNRIENIPSPSLEQCLSDPYSDYNRSDLLLSVRALKVIEQLVFSRKNSVSGPLTVCMSIAGIVELTPSFVSAQNALGLNVSYNTTEAYRLRLISEREKAVRGAWDKIPLSTEMPTPVCQFDNWDILPLHSVKADGKTTPKVNGSLVQGVVRGRKRPASSGCVTSLSKLQKTEWKHPRVHGDRNNFAKSFTSEDKNDIMDQFADIVFGLVSCHRDKLLGLQADSPSRTTGSGTRKKRRRTGVMNFRGLLLSAFKGHGGASVDDSNLFEQQVVYVDISRENAADTLTVRRMIHLIRSLLTPGRPGCPRFVVIGGDQPSYKMIYEIWLNSRRESRSKPNSRAANSSDLPLHEWLIPFPGFFHCEKQAMFSLCKELLDGLGLHEVAECVGLSAAQVSNILKHGHARNNRALLFSFACAMLIHVIDMVRRERPDVQKKSDALMQKIRSSKNVVTESGKKVSPEIDETRPRTSKAGLHSKTTEQVDDDVIELGKLLRNSVQEDMCKRPNGGHFISTVLLGCLLPTVGFHVLSRTGHTDVTEASWFRLTYLLHASNHLKYQELSLFYAFLRGILPTVVVSDLFKDVPGLSVMKLPSFTGSSRTLLNKFGWTYVQLDEALEMLIVRHLKSLCVTLLNHLENSAAWLMQVSNFRSLARRVTGASRAFGRFRGADDAGESGSALRFYDRNDLQSNTVSAMLKLMSERGFLDLEHRSSEWLTNVFCEPPKRIAKKSDQELILGINEHGETTTALHASVLFPEVFGCLTQEDRDKHFGGKKFKKWTSCRRIPTARQAMTKGGGVVQLSPYDDRPVGYAVEPHKRLKTEAGATKILSH